MHIELTTGETTREIEESEGGVTIQLPYSRKSWEVIEDITAGDSVGLTSADGDHFIGQVEDWDEARYTITVDLA